MGEKVKIEEMPEEVVEEVKVAEPEAKVMSAEAEVTEDEPAEEPLSTPGIITSQEVTEANETPDAFSAPVTEESAVTEEVTQATEVEEIVEEKIQQTEAEQIIQEVEDVLEGGDEDEEESEEEIVDTEKVGDAPTIQKVTINPQENEMEDEELE